MSTCARVLPRLRARRQPRVPTSHLDDASIDSLIDSMYATTITNTRAVTTRSIASTSSRRATSGAATVKPMNARASATFAGAHGGAIGLATTMARATTTKSRAASLVVCVRAMRCDCVCDVMRGGAATARGRRDCWIDDVDDVIVECALFEWKPSRARGVSRARFDSGFACR